ncbi:TPA: hypothetical protein ACGJSO_005436 [Pseudomonas aeruginosa]|uniref:hypothetical protein n=1 Tax=Pseudomonas aeruginosa TaxID=287 RepID=UPI00129884AC|nr:hypothetical protein [Pseudomonas aeruginosa]
MNEINKEEVEFWRKRSDIAEIKERYISWIYRDLIGFDLLIDECCRKPASSRFAVDFYIIHNEYGIECEPIIELLNAIEDYADSLDYDPDLTKDDKYSIDLAFECIYDKFNTLARIIEIQKVL